MKKSLVFLATVAFALVMFYSCNNGAKTEESTSPLTKGQWVSSLATFQFNDDMTGKCINTFSSEQSYDFTYTSTADSIFITEVSNDGVNHNPKAYAYELKDDGKSLRIYNSRNNYPCDWQERK